MLPTFAYLHITPFTALSVLEKEHEEQNILTLAGAV